jgi:uncharacterized protein YlxW (UPF0749 family)
MNERKLKEMQEKHDKLQKDVEKYDKLQNDLEKARSQDKLIDEIKSTCRDEL